LETTVRLEAMQLSKEPLKPSNRDPILLAGINP